MDPTGLSSGLASAGSPDRMVPSYQSKLGPAAWLGSTTEETIRRLAAERERKVLVCPISFTADCLETLEEIGIGYRRILESAGGELHLCPALNSHEPFIKCLATLALRGAKPVRGGDAALSRLFQPAPSTQPDELDIRRLVMIGVSPPGRLGINHGPTLRHVDRDQLRYVKRPHEEVAELLRNMTASETSRTTRCSMREFRWRSSGSRRWRWNRPINADRRPRRRGSCRVLAVGQVPVSP